MDSSIYDFVSDLDRKQKETDRKLQLVLDWLKRQGMEPKFGSCKPTQQDHDEAVT